MLERSGISKNTLHQPLITARQTTPGKTASPKQSVSSRQTGKRGSRITTQKGGVSLTGMPTLTLTCLIACICRFVGPCTCRPNGCE